MKFVSKLCWYSSQLDHETTLDSDEMSDRNVNLEKLDELNPRLRERVDLPA